jgi:hypothetical protein
MLRSSSIVQAADSSLTSSNYSVSFCFFQAFPFTASLTHPSSRLRQTDKRHQSTKKSIKPIK